MLRVLMDYHHHDLWESMELLCERLGWELYRPIGMDWFEQGYWNHERKFWGDAIARQYLEPWGSDTNDYDASFRIDQSHGRIHKMLSLEQARALRPDIVISSLAHNHEGFARFASEVGATFGLQIGNVRFGAIDMAEDRWDLAAFGLVSGLMPVEPPKPHVVYHQEFSLTDFRYEPPPLRVGDRIDRAVMGVIDGERDRFIVSSFVQCYPQTDWAYKWFQDVAHAAPDLDWRVYGAYGDAPQDEYAAGNLDKCADVASAMRASDVIWHAKRWSDGYGHVIHNAFAVGRPVFGFESYYRDQLAGALWEDGVTSIDIERRSVDEIAGLLRELRDDPDKHLRMCEAAAQRFREVVDFDAEAERIRDLFARVLP
jgi:hypothetical protein